MKLLLLLLYPSLTNLSIRNAVSYQTSYQIRLELNLWTFLNIRMYHSFINYFVNISFFKNYFVLNFKNYNVCETSRIQIFCSSRATALSNNKLCTYVYPTPLESVISDYMIFQRMRILPIFIYMCSRSHDC